MENTLGEQIVLLRNRYGYTQEDLANILGVSKQTVSNWETGIKNPRMGSIQKMADHFNVSKSFIIEGVEYSDITLVFNKLETNRQIKVYNYAKQQYDEQMSNNIIALPEFHDIKLQAKVSAGTGILNLDDPDHTEVITYKGKLPRIYDIAFKVVGDSMKPTFDDGDIIFVEKTNEAINGALMVIQIDEEAFVKKVYIDGDKLRLVSLNLDYKDIYADFRNDIRIIGKVVF